jgi:peptidyl-tRNA hydrolase
MADASSSAAAAGAAPASPSSPASPTGGAAPDPLLQYVVLRKDLGWPTGALVAQGCHACVAAVWLSRESEETKEYCAAADSMRKVTLEAPGADALQRIAESLSAAQVAHKLWVEQPEGVPTCLATAPGRASLLKPFFKALRLLR